MGRKKQKRSLVASNNARGMGEPFYQQKHLPLVSTPVSQLNAQQQATTMAHKVKQVKQSAGLMTCIFDHTVSETKANFEWEGPKMNVPNRDWWDEIMAFFEWTQREHHSEAQVRLFVNPTTREWKGWAFPQRGKTGMTTRELDAHPDTAIQRQQFGDGWVYYGTIHHHCSCSAFQSGTDSANEVAQDGLHITIGKVGSPHYDIHARVYQSKYELTSVGLETFWDVTELYGNIPAHLKAVLPENVRSRLAAFDMCVPPPANTAFPEIWKQNYIIEVPPVSVPTGVGTGYPRPMNHHYHGSTLRTYTERSRIDVSFDRDRAERDLKTLMRETAEDALTDSDIHVVTIKDIIALIDSVTVLNDWEFNILDIMLKNDVKLEVFNTIAEKLAKEEVEDELKQELDAINAANAGMPKEVGLPKETDEQSRMDYEGHYFPGHGQGFSLGG